MRFHTEETATVVSGFTHWNVLFQVQDEYKREVYQDLNTHTWHWNVNRKLTGILEVKKKNAVVFAFKRQRSKKKKEAKKENCRKYSVG